MDLAKFRKVELHRPTLEVEVPELTGVLFSADEPPVLLVRGLEFNEQQLANEQMLSNSIATALKKAVEKAQAGDTKDLVDVAAQLLGATLSQRQASETIYRIELILRGVITAEGAPLFTRQDVVKLGKHFPTSFKKLSDQINGLNGVPSRLGEPLNGTGPMTRSATL